MKKHLGDSYLRSGIDPGVRKIRPIFNQETITTDHQIGVSVQICGSIQDCGVVHDHVVVHQGPFSTG